MKNDEQLFFKIEDYLRGKLTPEEVAAFEQEIAADAELAELVKMQRFEREGLEFFMGENLRTKIKEWETSPPTFDEPSGSTPKNQRKWWIGLLTVVLLSVTVFLILKDKFSIKENIPATKQTPLLHDDIQQEIEKPLPTENSIPIAEEERKPTEGKTDNKQQANDRYENKLIALATSAHELPSNFFPDNQRSSSSIEKSPLAAAVAIFKQANPDYKKVISELMKINQKQFPQEYDKAQEMLAHAYFNDAQYDKAASIFQKMTEQDLLQAEHDQAEWFLLLSLIPDYVKQKSRVDNLLEKIANTKYHEFAKEALILKENLSNL